MINLQGPGSLKKICGVREDGRVKRISDLSFARKHLTRDKERHNIQKRKHIFAFVSSPKIYHDIDVIKYAKGWCHAFQNPKEFLPPHRPRKLLPESDFMDPAFIPYVPHQSKKYDFFYFTLNGKAGIRNKGLDVFCDCVKTLCGKMKLRGLVIVYFPNVPRIRRLISLNEHQERKLRKYKNSLEFMWGKLSYEQMAEIASRSQFGFFPNTIDNSPRTISETLIRDCPILVNEDIHGGWHYVNDQTGQLFNRKNLREKIEKLLTEKYNPREYFVQNYGFEKSTRRLAEFVHKTIPLEKRYTHMYFNQYEHYLREIGSNL